MENLNRGAVETWLVRMLQHARRRGIEVDWTFYCTVAGSGVLDDQARALGSRLVDSPAPLKKRTAFLRALRKEVRSGVYDVLHCHHDLMSAAYLLAAAGLPLRRRIVHVHNADESIPTPNRVKQRALREPMRQFCLAAADRIVGISDHTLDTFLAGRSRNPERDTVHHYGVAPGPFESARADRAAFRRALDVPVDAAILLFAGRLVPEKNPVFAIDVLEELRRLRPGVIGVFAGAGLEADAVLQRARHLGVAEAIRPLGWRSDLPAVMANCDLFILPHPEQPMEGFGIAVVEAQLAGLRLLLSTGIADDPLLPSAMFRRLPLSAGPSAWAQAASDLLSGPAPSSKDAIRALSESPMDMDRALQGLLALHA